ncbi:unnamed protein product [Ectocarpus fasciculatus]
MERERRRQALAPPPPQQQQEQLEEVVQEAAAGQGDESGGADAWEVEMAKAMAAAVAAAGGGIAGGAVPEFPAAAAADGDVDGLGAIPEGTEEGQEEEVRIGEEVAGGGGGWKKRGPFSRGSFTAGGSTGGGPDWSPNGGANGTFPLRRALTFGEVGGGGHSPCSPADSGGGGRLREVPLSEAQAMAESLRAWRQSFDVRNAFSSEFDEEEEDRGRAMSLQVQSRSFAQRGRATALVLSRTKWNSDLVGGGEGSSSSVEAKGLGLQPGGRSGGEEGSGAMAGGGGAASDGNSSGGGCVDQGQRQDGGGEKTHRTLSDQEWSASRRTVEMAAASEAGSLTNPVMAAFERERKEAAVRQAEAEDAQAARAAAMVKQAAAAATAKAGDGEAPAAAPAAGAAAGAAEDNDELHVGSVVRLGLNDAPGSAAAASEAGLRIAAEGISNLSLRSRDSVENLQERGEQSWGPLPLSSSA